VLNLARVLVLPSLMEGFGLAAVEAAACGCPLVATQEGPLPELLAGGDIFFDPCDNATLDAIPGPRPHDKPYTCSPGVIQVCIRSSCSGKKTRKVDPLIAGAGNYGEELQKAQHQ
jgi:hypothetical protein